jgi:GTPase SAR1 family protein
MKHNIVVIGPSKVGKTALVASLVQSANVISFQLRDENINVFVAPNNDITRKLFNQSLDIIRYNRLSFQGTQDIIDYEMKLESPHIEATFVDKIKSLIGIGEPTHCTINFPDAPGGALFQGDDDEYDTVVADKFRGKVVQKLRDSTGLIVCLDAAYLTPEADNENDLKEVALAFTKWLPDVFAEVVQNTVETKLDIKRVCFVMTKSDLWAHKFNWGEMAETSVQNRNAYTHAKDILGTMFFNSVRQYFHKDTEFAFCMSSVFGFLDGKVNEEFIQNMTKKRRRNSSDGEIDISVEDWQPYNVIEPFIFLLNGDNIDNRINILSWAEMGR